MSYLFSEILKFQHAPFSGNGMTKTELIEFAVRECLSDSLQDYLKALPEDQLYTSVEDIFGEIDEVDESYFTNDDE